MRSLELEREFESKGHRRHGLLLFEADVAISFVERARELGIAVLGVDSFRLDPSGIRPSLDDILDLSGTSEGGWLIASRFLSERADAGFVFEVVLA
jgi:hypothetical protein